MTVNCPHCNAPVAKIDRRRKVGERVSAATGATLEAVPKQAPKVRCKCGHVVAVVRHGEST